MKTKILNNIKAGTLLISKPFLVDYYFKRTVVLLPEHSEKGSMGFVLNKRLDVTVNDVVTDFPTFDAPLYSGGPVQTDMLYFIHTLKNLEGSVRIAKGLYMGGNFEVLKDMIVAGAVTPDDVRFFAGYSGWEKGQLEGEMDGQSWMVADTPANLMTLETTDLWGTLLRDSQTPDAIWGNFPENPSLN